MRQNKAYSNVCRLLDRQLIEELKTKALLMNAHPFRVFEEVIFLILRCNSPKNNLNYRM